MDNSILEPIAKAIIFCVITVSIAALVVWALANYFPIIVKVASVIGLVCFLFLWTSHQRRR